jgi:hypothetical protein
MEAIVTPAPPLILLALIAMSGTLSLLLFAAQNLDTRSKIYARSVMPAIFIALAIGLLTKLI